MADILFELVFEALFTGVWEGASSSRIPKPLRVFLAVLLILLCAVIIVFPAVIGVISLGDNVPFAVCLFLLSAFFAVALTLKAQREYRRYKSAALNNANDDMN